MSSTSPTSAPVTPASCTQSTCGSMVMTVTDAAGDFLSYQVSLVSLQLQKTDGTMVETLPATTAVDFAQLINLSEILSARQIPPGEYAAAQVTVWTPLDRRPACRRPSPYAHGTPGRRRARCPPA